jgi:Arc/MetJ-type ribon-helix-helix transcriptional regulator
MLLFTAVANLAKLANLSKLGRTVVLMLMRKPDLTPELDHFVPVKIQTGFSANASQGMRAALRLLELDGREREGKWQRFVPRLKLESRVSSIQAGEV